jgi:hypothetical protein
MNVNQIAKEFYAQYGLAMHTAHILENGLLELYALNNYAKQGISEKEYYQILGNPNKWTLGKLKDLIIDLNIFEESVNDKLKIANKQRIYLAHNFWWEQSIEFENEESLVRLHKEIFSFISSFNLLISIIDKKIKSIRNQFNLDIEMKMGLTDFSKRLAYITQLKK